MTCLSSAHLLSSISTTIDEFAASTDNMSVKEEVRANNFAVSLFCSLFMLIYLFLFKTPKKRLATYIGRRATQKMSGKSDFIRC